ncbi:hypothetical protein DCC85_22485 [Paenibacillus sp. CAA11]|nr:hypothetical protein DCC85_22485 [Paenibacillus sp. CAA11]
MNAETTVSVIRASIGFADPIGLSIPLLVHEAVARMECGAAGAKESDFHIRNVVPGRDFTVEGVYTEPERFVVRLASLGAVW